MNTWLRIATYAIPLLGALAVSVLGHALGPARRTLTAALFGLGALVALGLFVLGGEYACTFRTGRTNCLADGAGALLVILLDGILLRLCLRQRVVAETLDYVLLLLLAAGFAGIFVGPDLFTLIVALNVFWYAGYRLLKRKGVKWSLLVAPDDVHDPPEGRRR